MGPERRRPPAKSLFQYAQRIRARAVRRSGELLGAFDGRVNNAVKQTVGDDSLLSPHPRTSRRRDVGGGGVLYGHDVPRAAPRALQHNAMGVRRVAARDADAASGLGQERAARPGNEARVRRAAADGDAQYAAPVKT
ncbi:hypothetical protein BH23GEM6_BH23GEM6_28040 [soil metagenome]